MAHVKETTCPFVGRPWARDVGVLGTHEDRGPAVIRQNLSVSLWRQALVREVSLA